MKNKGYRGDTLHQHEEIRARKAAHGVIYAGLLSIFSSSVHPVQLLRSQLTHTAAGVPGVARVRAAPSYKALAVLGRRATAEKRTASDEALETRCQWLLTSNAPYSCSRGISSLCYLDCTPHIDRRECTRRAPSAVTIKENILHDAG